MNVDFKIVLENILIFSVLLFGIQVDYYICKIGNLKKRGNILIILICFFMLIISYGIIIELTDFFLNETNILNGDIIRKFALESNYIFIGLTGFCLTTIASFFYYQKLIASYFELKSFFNKIRFINFERSHVFIGSIPFFFLLIDIILAIMFIGYYLQKKFKVINDLSIGLLIIVLIIIFIVYITRYSYKSINNNL